MLMLHVTVSCFGPNLNVMNDTTIRLEMVEVLSTSRHRLCPYTLNKV